MKKKILIVVADHKRARFIHVSDYTHTQEWRDEEFENHIPEYSDRPGRTFDRFGMGRHSLADKISNSERAEEALAVKLCSYLHRRINEYDLLYLVIVPKIDGPFKMHCSTGVKLKLQQVFHKRMVNMPASEIWKMIEEKSAREYITL